MRRRGIDELKDGKFQGHVKIYLQELVFSFYLSDFGWLLLTFSPFLRFCNGRMGNARTLNSVLLSESLRQSN